MKYPAVGMLTLFRDSLAYSKKHPFPHISPNPNQDKSSQLMMYFRQYGSFHNTPMDKNQSPIESWVHGLLPVGHMQTDKTQAPGDSQNPVSIFPVWDSCKSYNMNVACGSLLWSLESNPRFAQTFGSYIILVTFSPCNFQLYFTCVKQRISFFYFSLFPFSSTWNPLMAFSCWVVLE